MRVRSLEPSDIELLYSWENDPEVWEYGSQRWPISMDAVKSFVEHADLDLWQTRQIRYMITADDGTTVGCVDLYDFDPLNMNAHVAIFVDKKHRRHGYARQAISEIETFAFQTYMMRALCGVVEESNTLSQRLFASLGYNEVGRRKQWIRHGNRWYDEIIFQKLTNL